MLDCLIIYDKESSAIKEKKHFYYKDGNELSSVVINKLHEGYVSKWDFIFKNENLETYLMANYKNKYLYDNKVNPLYHLNLPLIEIPNINKSQILSKNNVIGTESTDYGTSNYEIEYFQNYPVKYTMSKYTVYKYEYY